MEAKKRKSKFARIRECVDKKWSWGRGIRWIIEDEHGDNKACIHCGSMANGVVSIRTDKRSYNLPFCKAHGSQLPNPPEYAPFHVVIHKYKQRENVRKYAKMSFTDWLTKN